MASSTFIDELNDQLEENDGGAGAGRARLLPLLPTAVECIAIEVLRQSFSYRVMNPPPSAAHAFSASSTQSTGTTLCAASSCRSSCRKRLEQQARGKQGVDGRVEFPRTRSSATSTVLVACCRAALPARQAASGRCALL